MDREHAVIIGAGPAGLTAALELLERTPIHPIVLEATGQVGGLSRTVRFGNNRMDIGGHRFFSKSDRVLDWWLHVFPLQALPPGPRPQFLARPLATLREIRCRAGRPRSASAIVSAILCCHGSVTLWK